MREGGRERRERNGTREGERERDQKKEHTNIHISKTHLLTFIVRVESHGTPVPVAVHAVCPQKVVQ